MRESVPTETRRDWVGTSSLRESQVAYPRAMKNTMSSVKFICSPATPASALPVSVTCVQFDC
jgi:hypothetical protein